MKKLLAVVLSCVLCMAFLCMTACVSEEGELQSNIADETEAGTSEETQDGSQSSLAEEEDAFIGRMEGRTYINEYFDFYCALDNNWDILSEEELIQENKEMILSWDSSVQGLENLSWNDASIRNTLENVPIDMQIMVAKARNKSLAILVQKTGMKTTEEYKEFLEDYAETMETQYSSWSDNVDVNITETVFKGEQISDSINVSIDVNGQTTYQKLVFIHKDGYCLTILALSSSSFEEAESFFDWFGAAEDAVIIEAEPEVQYEVDYLLGTVEENVYTNEALGFRFEGGESCQYTSIEELQLEEGTTYDKDTLNKLLKWDHTVTVAEAELQGGGIDVMLIRRDAEYEEGITIRGNEELFIQELGESMYNAFLSNCEQVEMQKCAPENMGEVPIGGFDIEGIVKKTGQYLYARTLFVQGDDFLGFITLKAESEEEVQHMTELITKIEN